MFFPNYLKLNKRNNLSYYFYYRLIKLYFVKLFFDPFTK